MRLSLPLIASFFFFFKSFASGNSIAGYVWFNDHAGPNDCDLDDAGIVDDAVDDALKEKGVTEATSWLIGSSSYSHVRSSSYTHGRSSFYNHGRSLRGDGRELSCTAWCSNRCRQIPYMCYGVCAGCKKRDLGSNYHDEERFYVQETQPDYKSICETAVRTQATNDGISDTCQAALVSADCDVHY
jgi:hypothetical protein